MKEPFQLTEGALFFKLPTLCWLYLFSLKIRRSKKLLKHNDNIIKEDSGVMEIYGWYALSEEWYQVEVVIMGCPLLNC